jgi:hypothetical protein
MGLKSNQEITPPSNSNHIRDTTFYVANPEKPLLQPQFPALHLTAHLKHDLLNKVDAQLSVCALNVLPRTTSDASDERLAILKDANVPSMGQ